MKKFVTKFSILAGLCLLLFPAFLAAQSAAIFLAPPPDAPILTSPTNYTSSAEKKGYLAWQQLLSATAYHLQIGRDDQFSWMTLDTNLVPMAPGYPVMPDYPCSSLKAGVWYYWRVTATDSTGTSPWSETWSFKITGFDAVDNGSAAASGFRMLNAYPNPSNGITAVLLDIQQPGAVELRLYDPLGREQFRQTNTRMTAGQFPVTLDLSQLPAGVYFLRASVNGIAQADAIKLVRR